MVTFSHTLSSWPVIVQVQCPCLTFDIVSATRGWGFSHGHGIRICACLFERFFAKFVKAIGGFHQRRRSPHYKIWVYFGQIIVKSTQFDQNWVLFFRKWYTDGWEIRQKNWYRKSQIFDVRQAHPRAILVEVPPSICHQLALYCYGQWLRFQLVWVIIITESFKVNRLLTVTSCSTNYIIFLISVLFYNPT